MPTFDELSSQSAYPITHSQRKDGAILTAIRVPIDDVRLDRWGWILTLSHKDGSYNQDDIATLQDNSGQRYPKVYTITELLHYIEKWGCDNWETGYNSNGNRIHFSRITTPLNTDLLQREMLQETLEDIRNYQEEQTKVLNEEIASQNQTVAEAVFSQLTPHFTNIYGKQNQLSIFTEESRRQLDITSERLTTLIEQITEKTQEQNSLLKVKIESLLTQIPTAITQEVTSKFNDLVDNIDEQFDATDQESKKQSDMISERLTRLIEQITEKTQEQNSLLKVEIESLSTQIPTAITQEVTSKFNDLVDNIGTQLDATDQELKIQLSQIQSKTSRTIEDCLTPLIENSQKQLEVIDKEIKASLAQQSDQIKYLQDQIKKVLELTDLKLEDTDKTEDEDLAATANRLAKQPTTRIARIAASQLTIGNRYYDNVNEQSKRSFEIARRLSLIGGIVFIVTITIVIVAEALHITHDSALLPLGTIISVITELMAGLNLIYDKATKQFVRFHLFLDRIIRSSIAHAMIEEIKDPDRKQAAIEKVITELLEDDDHLKKQN